MKSNINVHKTPHNIIKPQNRMIYIRDNYTIFMFNQTEYNSSYYASNKKTIRKRQNERNQKDPEQWNDYIKNVYKEEPQRSMQIVRNRFNYLVRIGQMTKEEAKEKRLIVITEVKKHYRMSGIEGINQVLADLTKSVK